MTDLEREIIKSKIGKIAMGTAQLGLDYGIDAIGQPTEAEAFRMLKYALDNGLNWIDTSPIYGNSERRIGKFIEGINNQEVFVITRLEAQDFPEEIWNNRKILDHRIEREFRLSCANLNIRKIPIYMLHFADQAFRNNGMILDKLIEIKRRGYIGFIGTSLYTGEELERCIDDIRIDVVQVPFSILDRRLLESGLLGKAKERGIIIFARSVFLQGLVFMDRLPFKLSSAREIIGNLHHLADNYDMNISELCLRYVLSLDEISSVVVGVNTLEHVKENIKISSSGLLDKSILKEIEKLPQMPADLIDIRSWGQNYDFNRKIK